MVDFNVTQTNDILSVLASTKVRWLCSVDGNFSLDGYGGVTDSSITIIPNDYTGFASGYIYFTYFDDGCMRNYTHQVTYHDNSWENVFPEVDRFEAGFDNQYKEFTVDTNQKGWTVNVPQGYIAIKVSDSKFYLIKKSGGAEANIEASIRNNQVTIGASVDPTAVIIMEPAAISGLMYNGKEQALVSNGKADSKTGVIVYRLNGGSWITTPPKATDAGSGYTVCYMASGNTGYKNSEINCISGITIEKAPTTVVPPTAIDGLVYNGKEQALINPASSSAGTITYSLSESGTWSTSVPSVVNANENGYIVYYKVTPDSNHIGDASGSVKVSVAKGTPTITPPTPIEPTYNGQLQQLITPAFADFGVLYYQGGDQSSFKTTIPRATNVTTEPGYMINYKVSGDSNINEVVGSIYANIMKVTPTVVPPTPYSLSYTGEDRELIAAGSTNFGTLEYSGGNLSNWSTEIPKKSAVGRYTIFYRVSGDTNINEVSGSVVSEISTGKPEYTPPVGKTDLVFNGEEQELLISGSASGGTMYYSFNEDGPWDSTDVPTASGASAYTTYWFISGDTGLSNVGPIMIPVTIDKAPNVFIEEPTASAMTYMEESTPPYSGIAQQLVTSGVTSAGTSGGTILYKTSETEEWIEIVPSGTDAGDYTVYYMISGNSNYYDSESAHTEAVIAKKTPQVNPPKSNAPIVYDGQEHALLISGSVLNGWGEIVYSTDYTNWSTEVPSASTIGSYTVFWKLDGDKNHNGIDASSISVDIAMGVAEITKDPVAIDGLEYTGEMQNLVISGEALHGTMVYRIGNGEWSTELPQAKDKGNYVVYYMASGDSGYSDSSQFNLNCSIGLAKPEYTAPVGINVPYDGVEHVLLDPVGSVTVGGVMQYNLDGSGWSTNVPKATKAEKYSIDWKIVPNEGYSEVTGNVVSRINGPEEPEYTAPTGKRLTFTSTEQELIVPGNVIIGGVMKYSLYGSEWSTDTPVAIEKGTYNIDWKIFPDEGYTEVTGSVTSVISEPAPEPPEYVEPQAVSITYDGQAHNLVIAGRVTSGSGQFLYKVGETGWYDSKIPTGTEPGTYTINWKLVVDGSDDPTGSVLSTISSVEYTPPTPNEGLVYDGTNHVLVNEVSGEGVTFMYSVDEGMNWDTALPEKTDANENPGYLVKWVANKPFPIGDGSFYVKINRAKSSIEFVPSTISEMSIGDTTSVTVNVTGPSTYNVTYTSNRESIADCEPKTGTATTITAKSKGEAVITALLGETTNYKSARTELAVSVKSIESYSISIGCDAGSTAAETGIKDIIFHTSYGDMTLNNVNREFGTPEESEELSVSVYQTFSGKTIDSITFTDQNSNTWCSEWSAFDLNGNRITTILDKGHYYITALSCDSPKLIFYCTTSNIAYTLDSSERILLPKKERLVIDPSWRGNLRIYRDSSNDTDAFIFMANDENTDFLYLDAMGKSLPFADEDALYDNDVQKWFGADPNFDGWSKEAMEAGGLYVCPTEDGKSVSFDDNSAINGNFNVYEKEITLDLVNFSGIPESTPIPFRIAVSKTRYQCTGDGRFGVTPAYKNDINRLNIIIYCVQNILP